MEFQNVHPGVCISHQTGPSTIVFGGGSDRELRLKLLTPEREKEDTNHHGNANNRTQARWNDEPPITHRLTSPGVLLYQYPVFVRHAGQGRASCQNALMCRSVKPKL